MTPARSEFLTIGEAAKRAGVATSVLRFYESRGLIESVRTAGNQRRFARAELRRISLIRAAQNLGLSLQEIGAALDALPGDRVPAKADWARLSRSWQARLDQRIEALRRLRDDLTGCIGCGCLSLKSCALVNAGDEASRRGAGPRYLLGDRPRGPRRLHGGRG